ncbi:peptide deformylase [Bifidobacterium sp. ESL0763]|uniref:peptide deformylase n=1 Tax=Bifidobacterium sp. ESL0763 TaxID=2983227 RepID=UPI0023F735D9|nr:peptide deformylase [Bifidobacterium sp. ESL0763]MDF7663541.1 peptide deformylase [Bifidobacterium sp. ESL0763]
MQRPIITSPARLSKASAPATEQDLGLARDLKDTLEAYASSCVGMAANMVGETRRVIVFTDNLTGRIATMLNPEIVEKSEPYGTEEGCLCLNGMRKATRFRIIRVRYTDLRMREHTARFQDFTAQIIQHEIDHCDGILI